MSDGPHLQAAQAVAALLNGTWPAAVARPAGVAFTAAAKRFPKFKADGSDLKDLVVVVVPATPYTVTPENRGDGVTRECPVNVVIAQKVDRLDVARQEVLAALVDAAAELLVRRPIEGFGFPDADEGVEAEWDPDELDEHGLFFAVVGAVYRRTEGEDEE